MTLASCSSNDIESSNTVDNLTNLFFQETVEFAPNYIEGISMGMTAFPEENSLYISSRDDFPLNVGSNRELVVKVNLNDNSYTEKVHLHSDFITKRLFITRNKLVSFGGQFINEYDLNLSDIPSTETHGRVLSRFKIAENDNNVLIIGGDLAGVHSNKIYQWDITAPQNFVGVTELPEPRNGADGVVYNNDLYIFGGSLNNGLSDATDKIYIVSLDAPNNIRELSMGVALNETFVQKYNDHVIVTGQDIDGNPTIGKFNTVTEEFTLIEHNLADLNASYQIGQMDILNDRLYVVFGRVMQSSSPEPGLDSKWFILEAALN